MIRAEAITDSIVVTIDGKGEKYRLERESTDKAWYTWTESGWVLNTEQPEALAVAKGKFIDSDVSASLYSYRIVDASIEVPNGLEYEYSRWVMFGTSASAIGYTFGNYTVAEGSWGEVVTPDDLRYTYLWGTDFKATNGQDFTDEQARFFIDAATMSIARELNITIKKCVIRCEPEKYGLKKSTAREKGDYDEEEDIYSFREREINRTGKIITKKRPVLNVSRLDLIQGSANTINLLPSVIVEKQKGIIQFIKRPWKSSNSYNGLANALFPYGQNQIRPYLYYAIDYEAGFETSDDVPADLREIVAKQAAISLLNIIGDGLMSGFSSSSLSMDGISESFSSTQSATSAYFGARIAQYKDDISDYIQANKYKFNSFPISSI